MESLTFTYMYIFLYMENQFLKHFKLFTKIHIFLMTKMSFQYVVSLKCSKYYHISLLPNEYLN